jgi:LPXTG-site transpeptidase (sortase) family protein
MKRPDLANIDRTTAAGAGVMLVSALLLAVGLYFVVSALTDDELGLPGEGSTEDILADENTDIINIVSGGSTEEVDHGPKPTRLGIPGLFIDAPVAQTGFVPGTNQPDVPDRADLVAWYEFTPTPGRGSNAVFSGHVDWQTQDGAPIPGVFYRLRELKLGDTITVALDDGQVLEYRVTGNVAAAYDEPKLIRMMGKTTKDVVTLITCGGSWVADGSTENGGNYSHRVLVRAERVQPPAAASR